MRKPPRSNRESVRRVIGLDFPTWCSHRNRVAEPIPSQADAGTPTVFSLACPPTNSRYVRHRRRALAEQLFEPPRRNRGAKQKSLHLGAA
jgi:hypothetical protein